MRTPFNLLLCLTLAATPCLGQQGKQKEASSPPTTPRQKKIVTVDIPPTSYHEIGQAQISYFAESDTTEVRAELSVYRNHRESANMSFVFTVKGKRVVRPEAVSVGLAFFADKARAESLQGFGLQGEGTPFSLDEPTKSGVGYDYNTKAFFRDFGGKIPFAIFSQLANSASIKVNLGELVFELSKANRAALHDMLKAIESPSRN